MSITKRGNDTWRITVSNGFDGQGRRIRITETFRGTLSEARRRDRELRVSRDRGTPIGTSRETVARYLERWLAMMEGTVAPRTVQGYAGYVSRYLTPYLGHVQLTKLQPVQVQQMEAELRTRLSGTSVLHCHRILRKALQDALRLDLVPRNVADSVITPKKDTPEMRAFTAEELRQFLATAENSPFATLFHLAAQTGLRRSELCGLKWSDIDLEERTLIVRRTVQRVRGQGLVAGNPKTEKSRRTVVLGDEVAGKLRRHRMRQAESRLIASTAWIDLDHVFTQVDGRPVDPDGVTHTFATVARGLGMGWAHFHSLRHTHATLLFAEDVPLKTVSSRLGHSTIGITADLYTHAYKGERDEAAQAVDRALQRVSGP